MSIWNAILLGIAPGQPDIIAVYVEHYETPFAMTMLIFPFSLLMLNKFE